MRINQSIRHPLHTPHFIDKYVREQMWTDSALHAAAAICNLALFAHTANRPLALQCNGTEFSNLTSASVDHVNCHRNPSMAILSRNVSQLPVGRGDRCGVLTPSHDCAVPAFDSTNAVGAADIYRNDAAKNLQSAHLNQNGMLDIVVGVLRHVVISGKENFTFKPLKKISPRNFTLIGRLDYPYPPPWIGLWQWWQSRGTVNVDGVAFAFALRYSIGAESSFRPTHGGARCEPHFFERLRPFAPVFLSNLFPR